MPKKTLLVIFSLFFSVLAGDVFAVMCDVPLSGSYTVSESCAFDGSVNGVEEGNLVVNEGNTLTINADQSIVVNQGYSITVNGSIAISSSGAQILMKRNLYIVDTDNDGFPSTTTQVAAYEAPANSVRRKDLSADFTNVSDIEVDLDDSNACADSTYTADERPCGEPDNVAGTCDPVVAECNTVCTRCDGQSTFSEVIPSGSVCSGSGAVTDVSTSSYCDTSNDCDDGDCQATKYYHSCNGGGSCRNDTTDSFSEDIVASEYYVLQSDCSETQNLVADGYDSCVACDGDGGLVAVYCNGVDCTPNGRWNCDDDKCCGGGDNELKKAGCSVDGRCAGAPMEP
jgi:hypothetical protein